MLFEIPTEGVAMSTVTNGTNCTRIEKELSSQCQHSVQNHFTAKVAEGAKESRQEELRCRRSLIDTNILPMKQSAFSPKAASQSRQKAETRRNRGNGGFDFETCSSASSFPLCFKGFIVPHGTVSGLERRVLTAEC